MDAKHPSPKAEREGVLKFIYHDGGRERAGFKGKTGDCVVRSICIATGKSYREVYDALSKGCRNERGGKKQGASHGVHVQRKWFKAYMASLGFVWTPTMHIGSGCTVHLRQDELPDGRLVVNVSRHITAVIDGVIFDTYNPARHGMRCVYGYWRLP